MTVPLHDDPLLRDIPEVDGFKVLEPCVLYSKLGEGGMGAVYRGRHLNLDIDVAVKCLRRSLADQGSSFVQRFQREARLAAAIHHQNLVQVYDVSQKSGVHYLVMEFVSGETARDRVRRKGPLKVNEALRIALGAAKGLAEAHGRRIIHRDVKPDNVLISREGHVKVSDLGLAKALESEAELTVSQAVMGTPQYMAPEQWEDSSKVTPAADVWALGATLYYMLAGKDPIAPGTMQQVMRRICLDPFPDVRAARPEVPEAVASWIARCVARDVDERFTDCRAALAELKELAGQDRGELVSLPGETTQMGATMVSPPPPETLAKIRVKVETRGGTQTISGVAPPAQSPPQSAPPPPNPAPPTLGDKNRHLVLFGVVGSLVLASVAVFLATRKSPQRVGGDGKVERAGPMSARFDGVDARKGYLATEREFRLEGVIEGFNQSFRAEVRGKSGGVDVIDLGDGRFRFEFSFERDGKYELELAGERWEGPRSLPITVDSTAPRLASYSPKGPLARGASTKLTLDFDEELSRAEIDGDAVSPSDERVRWSGRAPSDEDTWEIEWRVIDRAGHEASGTLELPMEPAPVARRAVEEPRREEPPPKEPAREDPPKASEPAPLPSTSTPARSSPANLVAPKGCMPAGDESLTLGGRSWAKHVRHQRTGIELVLIPPGSFAMGSDVASDKAPAPRRVQITAAFYMSENEVSSAAYERVLGRGAGGDERTPKSGLSWKDAKRFCDKADLFLPSEAQWEYACRASGSERFAFGASVDEDEAVTRELGRNAPQPAGERAANAFGLRDMHGNVAEFCLDEYLAPEDYAKLAPTDPLAKRGKGQVLRGGSYLSASNFCAAATRKVVDDPEAPVLDAGLRVVLKLD